MVTWQSLWKMLLENVRKMNGMNGLSDRRMGNFLSFLSRVLMIKTSVCVCVCSLAFLLWGLCIYILTSSRTSRTARSSTSSHVWLWDFMWLPFLVWIRSCLQHRIKVYEKQPWKLKSHKLLIQTTLLELLIKALKVNDEIEINSYIKIAFLPNSFEEPHN